MNEKNAQYQVTVSNMFLKEIYDCLGDIQQDSEVSVATIESANFRLGLIHGTVCMLVKQFGPFLNPEDNDGKET